MSKANKLCVSLIVAGAFLACMPQVRAQGDQQLSVADAARKSRELKKDAAKPTTVITNDTLEPETPAAPAATPGASGETNATNTAASTSLTVTAAPDAAAGGNTGSNEAQGDKNVQSAEAKGLKQQIAEKQIEVDLAQRALALANDDFYSRPDFSKDDERKAKLEAMKSDLAQKQDELAELKSKLAEAGTEEKPASAESQQSRETAEPQSPSQPESPQQTQPQSQPQQP